MRYAHSEQEQEKYKEITNEFNKVTMKFKIVFQQLKNLSDVF